MTNQERALNYVALFNHYDATGADWRKNVPLDAAVHGDTAYIGGWRLRRNHEGKWAASSNGETWESARFRPAAAKESLND